MTRAAEIDRKSDRLRALVANIDNVYFNIKSERHSLLQGCCHWATAASRTSSSWLKRTAATGGPLWRRRASTPTRYLYRDRTADAFLPWQIIDGGFKTTFLQERLVKERTR